MLADSSLFTDIKPRFVETYQAPRPLDHESWPPNYTAVYAWRSRMLAKLRADPIFLASARSYYSTRPVEFIAHWIDTYDPRRPRSKWVPFVPFERQSQLITLLHLSRTEQEHVLIEKCRDAGVTWIACAYSVWSWLFIKDDSVGWGSRKSELVDRLGEPDSIFEKMRLILRRMPDFWLPAGFNWKLHATHMKITNPVSGAVISGESGDNIGRGGRKSIFFKDEAAHLERPEKVQAALDDNTNVQIDISSVNGLGNVFHRRRMAGMEWSPDGDPVPKGRTRVFVFDWRHHPEKTQEWYDQRKAKAEREGMQANFAQEVDRDYSAAISNTTIPREYVQAAVDAHLTWDGWEPPNLWMAGLDVADGGIDRNGLALRQSVILRHCTEWGERDAGVTTRRVVQMLTHYPGISVQYDCIGIGAAVKSEYNRLTQDDKLVKATNIDFVPWNAGGKVVNPFDHVIPDDDKSALNKSFFGNFKAQAWWSLRTRFYKTWRMKTQGVYYPPEELISLDSKIPLLHQVIDEIAQATTGQGQDLRMIINKAPDGMKSPNMADSVVMSFFPAEDTGGYTQVGSYSG